MIKEDIAKLVGLVGEPRGLRKQADQMRDRGRFAEAAELYGRYLSRRPNYFGIWVQRGNCLKDIGAFGEAKLAYARAIELNPNDADVHLQMGHLMKLQGDREAALRAYRQSEMLDAARKFAAAELRRLSPVKRLAALVRDVFRPSVVAIPELGTSPAQIPVDSGAGGRKAAPGPAILDAPELSGQPAQIFDITDLLLFLDDNTRVTGVQRVQCSIVGEIVADASEADGKGVIVAYYDPFDGALNAVSPVRMRALIQLVGSTDATSAELKRQLQDVYASKRPIRPRASDSFIVLGAYWIVDDFTSVLMQLKSAGVCIGVYVHDLMPITYPQFVHDGSREATLRSFKDVTHLVDFVLTNSEFVAKEVTEALSSELNRSIPVLAVPLAHELAVIRDQDEADEAFAESLPREYVLCVGTLEGRKNHLLLLNAWRALSRKHGGRIPCLILVGKWGWRGEEFRDQLRAQRNVGGKIIVLGSVSDGQLKCLYEHCLFTVFPSFAEGWGLPIGESLAYGKPCIASNATAMPEVGGDFCRYIDPYDPIAATAEIERAFVDRAGLRAWTDRIAAEFKVRTWTDVADDLLRKAKQASAMAREAPRQPIVTLEPGRLYQLTRPWIHGGDAGTPPRWGVKFVCAAGWGPLENWGCWSFRPTAVVQFGAGLPPGTKLQLYLKLCLPQPLPTDSITIQDWAHKSCSVFIPGAWVWAKIDTEADDYGDVRVQLERLGEASHLEPCRELYIGIGAVAYLATDDVAQRVDLLEEMFLFDNAPLFDHAPAA